MSSGPQNESLAEDLDGNTFKKVLVVGKTGAGKSSLCNVIAGEAHDSDLFHISASVQISGSTTFRSVSLNGNDENTHITLIDTEGYKDPERDLACISDLVTELRTKYDYVNLFVIAISGQEPCLDGSLIGLIKIFEGMFGAEFWSRAVIVFTRLRMDSASIKSRERIAKQNDAELAEKYITSLQEKLNYKGELDYLILDSCRDTSDHEEEKAFQKELGALHKKVENAPPLYTDVEKLLSEMEQQINKEQQMNKVDKEQSKKELDELVRKCSRLEMDLKKKDEELKKWDPILKKLREEEEKRVLQTSKEKLQTSCRANHASQRVNNTQAIHFPTVVLKSSKKK